MNNRDRYLFIFDLFNCMRSNPKCIASNNFMVINRDVFVKNRSWSNLTYLFWKYTKQGTA